MRYVLGVIVLLLCCINGKASDVDSLLHVLNGQNGENRVETLLLLLTTELDSSKVEELAQEAIRLASEESVSDSLIIKVYLKYGDWYSRQHAYSQAVREYQKALEECSDGSIWRGTTFRTLGMTFESMGQHIESLKYYKLDYQEQLRSGDLIQQSASLTNIGISYWFLGKLDTARYFLLQTIQIDSVTENYRSMAAVKYNLAAIFQGEGALIEASESYYEAISLYGIVSDGNMVATCQRSLAGIYMEMGVYDLALELALVSLTHFEGHNLIAQKAYCHNTLGNIYYDLQDYEKSLYHYEQSLKLKQEINAERGQANTISNIGRVYEKLGEFDVALDYYNKSLIKKRAVGMQNVGSTLINIGNTYVELDRNSDAEKVYKEAIQNAVKHDDGNRQAEGRDCLARLYLTQNRYAEAEHLLNTSRVLSERNADLNQQLENYRLSTLLYEQTGRFEQALQYSHKLRNVSELVLNEEKQRSIQEMDIRYTTEKVKQQNEILKTDAMRDKLILEVLKDEQEIQFIYIVVLIAAAIFLLTLAVVFYRRYLEKRRSNDKIKMLMRELHHRVKNNLQVLSSLLSLQGSRIKDKNAKLAVRGGQERVKAMMLIHKKLYKEDGQMDINMKDYVHDLTNYLMTSYGILRDDLELKLDIDELNIDVDRAIPIGLILSELITNCFKYAYVNNDNPALFVRLQTCADNQIVMEVADNGKIELDVSNLHNSESFGLKMVDILMKQLKAKLDCKYDSGLAYRIEFPQ